MNGELFGIFRMSIKATHREALTFICFTVLIFLNILYQHFSTVFLNFCLMSVVFFAGYLKIIAQRLGFHTFFVTRGWGIHPFKKNPQEFVWGA